MIITLNDTLSPPKPWEPIAPSTWNPDPVRQFAENVGRTGNPETGKQLDLLHQMRGEIPHFYTKGYMHLLSQAYSQHYAIEIAPHDVWYIVLTQLAELVKNSPDKYRSLFTTSADKKMLVCEQAYGSTEIDLDQLLVLLKANIPMDSAVFLPELSTNTPESYHAQVAAFADGMSVYYSYGMMCCGLPSIHIKGTPIDWLKLVEHTVEILKAFHTIDPKAKEYLTRVHGLLLQMGNAFLVQDKEFWAGIFTQKNVGSGGQIDVNGWFKDLFLDPKNKGDLSGHFNSAISKVPVKNLDTGREFVMMFGAFKGIILPENVLQAQYGHITFESVPKRPYSYDAHKKLPNLTVTSTQVESATRQLDTKWVMDPQPDVTEVNETLQDEMTAAIIYSVNRVTSQ